MHGAASARLTARISSVPTWIVPTTVGWDAATSAPTGTRVATHGVSFSAFPASAISISAMARRCTASTSQSTNWCGPWERWPKVWASAPRPRGMPRPQLLYAQVVKTVRRRRLVRVRHRVVFGTLEAVEHVLAACGWQINTAFIERVNLSMRQHVAAVGRRVSTLCKGADGLHQQLALYHMYYNFCLPHASLRHPLLPPEPTHGTGSAKRWQPRTPAMAAGLTDHVWTLREG